MSKDMFFILCPTIKTLVLVVILIRSEFGQVQNNLEFRTSRFHIYSGSLQL